MRYAHMELADPNIAAGFPRAAPRAGATDVTVFRVGAFTGAAFNVRQSPDGRLTSRASSHVSFSVTPAFGLHEKLAEVVLERARPWHPCRLIYQRFFVRADPPLRGGDDVPRRFVAAFADEEGAAARR